MAAAPPSSAWDNAFSSVGGQGTQFQGPLSASNTYYAYLSKADLNATTGQYDIFFEAVAKEWMDNVFFAQKVIIQQPPIAFPVLGFHVPTTAPTTLFQVLGIKSDDYLAESSWYLLVLAQGSGGSIVGDLYDPDIDLIGSTAKDYGNYSISSATLMRIPQMIDGVPVLAPPTGGMITGAPPPDPHRYPRNARTRGGRAVVTGKRTRDGFLIAALPAVPAPPVAPPPVVVPPPVVIPPPPPPPPATAAVAVNDIGQGNCTMLLGQPAGAPAAVDVIAYFDIGFPLWFYYNSPPVGLRTATVPWLGPVVQNQAGNLSIYLSHWDWDHWRLGRIANLVNLPWFFPQQPAGISPSAVTFIGTIPVGNRNQIAFGGGPMAGPGGSTVFCCNPGAGAVPAFILNNSGLAIAVPTNIPVGDVNQHYVAITGDANFNSVVGVPANVQNNISCILAVHHGSNAHGAAGNLPAAVPTAGNTGYIAYSYGIMPAGTHAYGFPVAAAVVAYQGGAWGNIANNTQESTAEGPNVNVTGLAGRGNVRIGNQTALNAAYNNSSFFANPPANALQ